MPFYEVQHNWNSGWSKAPEYGYFPEREDITRNFLVLFHGCLDSEEWDPTEKVLTLVCGQQVMRFTEVTQEELEDRLRGERSDARSKISR